MNLEPIVKELQHVLEFLPFVEISREQTIALLLVAIFISIDIALRLKKRRIWSEYQLEKSDIKDVVTFELHSHEYYSRMQLIDIIRFICLCIGIFSIAFVFDIKATAYLAVAFGALIVIFKDIITSLAAYFYIIANFSVGDVIKIGGELGEVLRVRPLFITLSGKEPSGDYSGKVFHIPNNTVMTTVTERQELSASDVRRVNLNVIYDRDAYVLPFEEWLKTLREFMSANFVSRNADEVGNYKGYSGIPYKLRYDYNDKGELIVSVSFITEPKKVQPSKELIVSFVEKGRVHSITHKV